MRSVIIAAILFLNLPVAAQFKFQTVDIAGAVETQVRGVNNSGEIVGFYRLATAECIPFDARNPQAPSCDVRGFKIVNGVLTKLRVPGSLSTAIMGVNDAGDLVGYYTKTSDACIIEQHGFIWYHQNVIKTIDYPEWTGFCGTDALWTVPFGINRVGTVVGTVWSPIDAQPSGGFVYKNGAFSVMNLGGASGRGCYTCTGVYGLSNNGIIVGTGYRVFGQIPMWVGYMKMGSDEDFFTRTQDDTWVTGVNNKVDIVGYGVYGAGFFASTIEANEGTNDAVEVEPKLIPVHYPESVGTYPFALNYWRTVVGAYVSVDGKTHGFVAAPTF